MIDPLDYAGNVHHWAGRYLAAGRARGLDRDDLAQIGYIAIIRAWRAHVKNGRPDATFPGYVTSWIRGTMSRAVAAAETVPTIPLDDDLDAARPEPDDGDDRAAAMLGLLTDQQARAVELRLGLDGTPGRSLREVQGLTGWNKGNAYRLIKAGLDNLRRHHNQSNEVGI